LPEGFIEHLEADVAENRLTPEEFDAELMRILATDHTCGERAVTTVNYEGRTVHLCAWHEEQYRTVIAPFFEILDVERRLTSKAATRRA